MEAKETVTITLEHYENMKARISLLEEQVKEKTVIKEIEDSDKSNAYRFAIAFILGLILLSELIRN